MLKRKTSTDGYKFGFCETYAGGHITKNSREREFLGLSPEIITGAIAVAAQKLIQAVLVRFKRELSYFRATFRTSPSAGIHFAFRPVVF